jgi:hypothetical protein
MTILVTNSTIFCTHKTENARNKADCFRELGKADVDELRGRRSGSRGKCGGKEMN